MGNEARTIYSCNNHSSQHNQTVIQKDFQRQQTMRSIDSFEWNCKNYYKNPLSPQLKIQRHILERLTVAVIEDEPQILWCYVLVWRLQLKKKILKLQRESLGIICRALKGILEVLWMEDLWSTRTCTFVRLKLWSSGSGLVTENMRISSDLSVLNRNCPYCTSLKSFVNVNN